MHFPPGYYIPKTNPPEYFEYINAIYGTHLIFIVFIAPMWTIRYEPIFLKRNISIFGIPATIFDVLKVSDTTSFDGNLSRKYTTPYIGYLLIIIVYIFNVTAFNVDLARSLIVHIDHSSIAIFPFFAYMCSKPGSTDVSNVLMLNLLSLWQFVILKSLVYYFIFPQVLW